MYGIWMMGYGEWVGSTGTATKPDRVIVNPAWASAQAIRARDIFRRREPGNQRPREIALWRTRDGARAEINAFEPKKRVPGAERVREYSAARAVGSRKGGTTK